MTPPKSVSFAVHEDSFIHITHDIDKLTICFKVTSNPLSFVHTPRIKSHLANSVRDLCAMGNSTDIRCASNAQDVLGVNPNTTSIALA